MQVTATILYSINSLIQKQVPGAKVSLFGSRATGTATEESDWDILILTNKPVTADIKKLVHDTLFPFSVEIGAFINTLTVHEDEWLHDPSYYTIRQTTKGVMLQA